MTESTHTATRRGTGHVSSRPPPARGRPRPGFPRGFPLLAWLRRRPRPQALAAAARRGPGTLPDGSLSPTAIKVGASSPSKVPRSLRDHYGRAGNGLHACDTGLAHPVHDRYVAHAKVVRPGVCNLTGVTRRAGGVACVLRTRLPASLPASRRFPRRLAPPVPKARPHARPSSHGLAATHCGTSWERSPRPRELDCRRPRAYCLAAWTSPRAPARLTASRPRFRLVVAGLSA